MWYWNWFAQKRLRYSKVGSLINFTFNFYYVYSIKETILSFTLLHLLKRQANSSTILRLYIYSKKRFEK